VLGRLVDCGFDDADKGGVRKLRVRLDFVAQRGVLRCAEAAL
jgi:hypothetical protein